MQQMQMFKNTEFGEIRTLTIDNQPYFVGKEVATILGYAKPLNALATHIDADDSLKKGLTDNMGRIQDTILINESGLYCLILSSKLPKAKNFKRWVTGEVLPQIRRTGSYQRPMTQAEIIAAQGQLLVGFEREINELRIITTQTSNRVDKVANLNAENWRNDAMERVGTVCDRNGVLYVQLLGKIFAELERVENCRLSARLNCLRKRLKDSGCTHKQVKATAKIDVVAQDKKLRRAFDYILDNY